MGRQRDILPQVLAFVREQVGDCPVYLSGSVSLGHERPDSDIDLMVLVTDVQPPFFPNERVVWREDKFKLVAARFQGIPVHLHFITPALLRDIEENPWRGYKFLKTERLHDPEGVIQRTKDRVAPWFDAHPDAVAFWEAWLDQHKKRQLSGGEKIGPLVERFPSQVPDLWDHLDRVYGDDREES